MAKENEEHVTILTEHKQKLREIAVKERRSMRAVVSHLIDEAYSKTFKGEK